MSQFNQLTLFEELERVNQIERLARSLTKWQERELDRILPEDYQYYCRLLDYLKAGGAYTVIRYDPATAFDAPSFKDSELDMMFRSIGAGLAGISRSKIVHTRARQNEQKY
jgi:hypothetical protein